MGDRFNQDLYFQIYRAFVASPTRGQAQRLRLLENVAREEVGAEDAATLVDAWLAVDDVQQDLLLLHRGGFISYMGSVQQRWLTRPFVPFPEELTKEEQSHYRPFLFQARDEKRAQYLGEVQGTRWFGNNGGRPVVVDKVLQRLQTRTRAAGQGAARLKERLTGKKQAAAAHLHARLRAFEYLLHNARNAVDYQYYLDIAQEWDLRRPNEDLDQLNTIPEWRAIREIARREIDNTVALITLLESDRPDLIDVAPTRQEESIRVLGPDLADQL